MKAIRIGLPLLMVLSQLVNSVNSATLYLANNASENVYTVDISSQSASLLGSSGINLEFGGLGFAQDGTLYGWNTSTNQLYTVNKSNGAWNLVGGSGPSTGDTFDINPLTNEAIVTDSLNQELHTVTLATGASALKVSLTNFVIGAASAFGPNGTLYYIDIIGGQNIRSADTDTGLVSVVGATGIPTGNFFTNLSYNPEDDMLYSVVLDGSSLFRFDPSTGAGVNLGPIANLPIGEQYTMSTIRVFIPEPTNYSLAVAALCLVGIRRRQSAAEHIDRRI